MAFGNNRSGKQGRANFQLAGGTTVKFKHPYLAGQLDSTDSPIDEIDISSCVKLDGRYFEANPNQDSARQVVLIDGSTVTICNRLLNGTITMPVVRTTGTVAGGDFVSVCQLIKSVGDTVGGLLYKTDYRNGLAITRLYYGVTVQRVPDDVSEGQDVGVYNIQLLYAGWIEAVSTSASDNYKKIWAVGSSNGVKGMYSQYKGNEGGTGEDMLSVAGVGVTDDALADTTDNDTASYAEKSMEASKSYGDTANQSATIVAVESKLQKS